MDTEEILALFGQTNWDDIDKEHVVAATRASQQIIGAYPDAGWVERTAELGFWFVAGHDELIHVTGSRSDWRVAVQRPMWASTTAQLQGEPNSASFKVALTLKTTQGDEITMSGGGRSAKCLLTFYQGHLSKLGT